MQWEGELVCFFYAREGEGAAEGSRGYRGSFRHIHQLVLGALWCQTWRRADTLLHTPAKRLACEKALAEPAWLKRLFLSAQMMKKTKT